MKITIAPYTLQYNGKELQLLANTTLIDYGARQYNPTLARWTAQDPMAEKYYGISPYMYCAGNPISRIDPTGMDDYRYDKKNGTFHLMAETDDKTDRVLDYKYDKASGEYYLRNTKKNKQIMSDVEKGILKDGIDFKNNNNMIAVGGEEQPTIEGVEAFAVKLSNLVSREIGGTYFSRNKSSSPNYISIGRWIKNTYTETNNHGVNIGSYPEYRQHYKEFEPIGFFHTHPSKGFNPVDIYNPSERDINYKNKNLDKKADLRFYLLANPKDYGDKFPFKDEYTHR